MSLLGLITNLLEICLAGALLYYYVLLIASIPGSRTARRAGQSETRFALLIPAHNEATVIGDTVRNLLAVDYPDGLFDVLVVADYCEDETAETARAAGAICCERRTGEKGRKGFALAWMLQRVLSNDAPYDAYVIFDADSRVNSAFLQEMDARLADNARALQGQHVISNTDESLYNRMAAIDMRLNNRLRNKAKDNLGLSCRLMGDAMCFSREVLEENPWETYSLVEDMEYGIQLLRRGVKVRYVEEARSHGQAAGDWQRAEHQRLRWSGGFLDVRRRLGLSILAEGARKRDWALLDRAGELLMPSYSTLVVLSLLLVILRVFLVLAGGSASIWDTFLIFLAWITLPLLGLLLDRAPRRLFTAYVFSPLFLAWRIWIGVLTFVRGRRIDWVRTPRREEG